MNIEYVSDPSIDLIEKFKKDIVKFKHPSKHPAFVKCTHVQESAGHLLFILDGRVELVINQFKKEKFYFLFIVKIINNYFTDN
ncbi:MAG: hypothetical protein IS860_11385 [Nitrosopumilus sp.]|nr:hypothetical protein [Nitrosopumilus sp.]